MHCTHAAAQPRNIIHPRLRHSSCSQTTPTRVKSLQQITELGASTVYNMSGCDNLLVVEGWQQTSEARGYINALLKRNKRKQPGKRLHNDFIDILTDAASGLECKHKHRAILCSGILERSALLEQFQGHPVLFYRLFLLGKSGVGKTSTVNKICGRGTGSYMYMYT